MEMQIAMGPLRVEPPKPQGAFCPYLDLETKRCTIHSRRPLICRLYGISEGLPCPFGCKPKPRMLTNAEARKYIQDSIRLSEDHA